jgi:hypothetical protein|tara:strand:+ start:208 stop:603 length:396 start_codon:yes stop_codon:yes gene_type:complete
MAYKVRYKNHCTPQEQTSSGGRFYLDSDCGRKLTGDAETSAALLGAGAYNNYLAVSGTQSNPALTSKDFLYIKNIGATDGTAEDVLITLDDNNYLILLSLGESFASEISTSAQIRVKTASGTSAIEYFVQA